LNRPSRKDLYDERIQELHELISHCYIHSSYKQCGYNQMTTKEKELFCSITGMKDEVDIA